ncbi:MAG: arginase family protein, partial [Candidatus Diapherotrites archaeon]|nr:arginase family protein [Candidatus Diapherotrites archaeon]
ISAREVRENGMRSVLKEALVIARNGVEGFYLTFDIDVFSYTYAPGTPGYHADGISAFDAFAALIMLGQEKDLIMMDLVEIDPALDVNHQTARLGADLVLHLLGGLALRKKVWESKFF